MDYYKYLDLIQQVEEDIWLRKINEGRLDGRFCSWIPTFHSEQLVCHLEGDSMNGSYNVCQKFAFDDGTVWILRLPRVASISSQYADEEIVTEMEVEALGVLRKRTTIPVPKVGTWGAQNNPLGLGPFLIMDFIGGIRLGRTMIAPGSRLITEDIRDADIEFLYRQMAMFMLQMFDIDIDRIGSPCM